MTLVFSEKKILVTEQEQFTLDAHNVGTEIQFFDEVGHNKITTGARLNAGML